MQSLAKRDYNSAAQFDALSYCLEKGEAIHRIIPILDNLDLRGLKTANQIVQHAFLFRIFKIHDSHILFEESLTQKIQSQQLLEKEYFMAASTTRRRGNYSFHDGSKNTDQWLF